MGQQLLFNDPELLVSLLETAFAQLMGLLDYLEAAHHEDITTDKKFQIANNLSAAFILWRMQDPSLFNILPELLRQARASKGFCGSNGRPHHADDATGAGHAAGH